jgi:porin
VKASYQVKLSDRIAIQPDVQYIIHPAGVAHAPNSLGEGLRLVITAVFPRGRWRRAPPIPTGPPDGAPTTASADVPQRSNNPSQ